MKKLSPAVMKILASDTSDTILLYEIGPAVDGSYIRGVTLPYGVTYNNTVFPPDTRVSNVDPPRLSNVLDRDAYKISLVDPLFSLRAMLEDGLRKSILTVYAGFLQDGVPLLGNNDVFVVYSGQIDGYAYVVTPEGDVTVTLEGSSPMGSVGLARSILTSKEWMRQLSASDTSFDQVYVGSQQVTLKWGKK